MKLKINLKFSSFAFILVFGLQSFAKTKIEEVFKENSDIESPMELRDPFLAPKFKSKRLKDAKKKSKGIYTNIPQLGNVELDKLKIVGVVIGTNRRAFAVIEGRKEVFTLKEGMKLGANKATLRAILPGGLVLVEKNTNIYGEDEYLETVIPLSK